MRIIHRALRKEVDAGLVTIETNVTVRGYCFDIMIREVRVLIEIDSYTYHGAGNARRSAFLSGRHKGNRATRFGYRLLRFTGDSVRLAPKYVGAETADTVRFLLEHRRLRREDEAIDTDRQVWLWHPSER